MLKSLYLNLFKLISELTAKGTKDNLKRISRVIKALKRIKIKDF